MTPGPGEQVTLHAGCVVVGEAGVLLRGPSGIGKSTLARRLVAAEAAARRFGAHVADDRVMLRARAGRLLARPHPAIAGRLEVGGCGIAAVRHLREAVIRLVVDLVASAPARLTEAAETEAELLGIRLPRLVAVPDLAEELVRWRLRGRDDTPVTEW